MQMASVPPPPSAPVPFRVCIIACGFVGHLLEEYEGLVTFLDDCVIVCAVCVTGGACLSLVVLVAGFAFLANLLYGGSIDRFHNLTSSFSTLLRFPLGDFNYEELQTVGVVLLTGQPGC
jgi:hypothetical protein